MFTMQNGLGIALPHFFRMQTHRVVLEEFQYYYYTLTREFICLTLQDVILKGYKLPFTKLFDTDR